MYRYLGTLRYPGYDMSTKIVTLVEWECVRIFFLNYRYEDRFDIENSLFKVNKLHYQYLNFDPCILPLLN
jgi:hypothetical protein